MDKTGEQHVALKVGGMTCGHCVARVRKALDETSGVTEATVDLETGTANVRLGEAIDTAALIEAVEKAGYTAGAN